MLKSLLRSLFLYLSGLLFGGLKRGFKMPSLERFFNPQMRVFDLNVKSLPGARLYFFSAGTTTPKTTYADKAGATPNPNPVIADASGSFPQIFLDGLYRVELRSSTNIVQPGWPIDNVGQDTPIVPYANWRETVAYAKFERVTDPLTGISYRSKENNNLGNVPATSSDWWEVIADTVSDSFTSDKPYFTWGDSGADISLNVDTAGMAEDVAAAAGESSTVAAGGDFVGNIHYGKIGKIVTITTDFLTHGNQSDPSSSAVIPAAYRPDNAVVNTYYYNGMGNIVATATVTTGGQIFVSYRNTVGNNVDRTNIINVISFSYIKQ